MKNITEIKPPKNKEIRTELIKNDRSEEITKSASLKAKMEKMKTLRNTAYPKLQKVINWEREYSNR